MRLAAEMPASFVAFDVLQAGGEVLLAEPYAARRARLEWLFEGGVAPPWLVCRATDYVHVAQKWLTMWLQQALQPLAKAVSAGPQSTGWLANLSFLVGRGAAEQFLAAVDERRQEHPHLQLRVNGPLPPCSFVDTPSSQQAEGGTAQVRSRGSPARLLRRREQRTHLLRVMFVEPVRCSLRLCLRGARIRVPCRRSRPGGRRRGVPRAEGCGDRKPDGVVRRDFDEAHLFGPAGPLPDARPRDATGPLSLVEPVAADNARCAVSEPGAGQTDGGAGGYV
ncbi:GvpL/GvpF family gas vesicle protein, partial [Streptomyces capoamus]|uniref:GvpL/GvpF family gas vesicle protein n=1 Tax=Streptomyces capoamus TaxID=68183 RepID=UPI00351A13DA